jgi:hypothetical protein
MCIPEMARDVRPGTEPGAVTPPPLDTHLVSVSSDDV